MKLKTSSSKSSKSLSTSNSSSVLGSLSKDKRNRLYPSSVEQAENLLVEVLTSRYQHRVSGSSATVYVTADDLREMSIDTGWFGRYINASQNKNVSTKKVGSTPYYGMTLSSLGA